MLASLASSADPLNGSRSTTGADGAFKLRLVPGENNVRIASRPEGYTNDDVVQTVALKEGDRKELTALLLTPALKAFLRLTDESGKPVAALLAQITHPNWGVQAFENAAQSDATGLWDSTNGYNDLRSDAKEPWEVRLPNGYEVVSPTVLTLPSPDPTKPITVVVRKVDESSRAGGTVTLPDGKPVVGANISAILFAPDKGEYTTANVESDVNGRFVFPLLKPNTVVTVSVSKWEHRLTGGDTTKKITVPGDGKQPCIDDFVLTPLTGTVSGTLSTEAKTPVAGAWIWSPDGDSRSLARTDVKGRFTVAHLLPTGDISLKWAARHATGALSAAKRTGLTVLVPVPAKATKTIPATPAQTQAARRKSATRLLREWAAQDEPGQGTRQGEYARDALSALVAPFDLPLALSFLPHKDGTIAEFELGGVLQEATATAPDAVKAVFLQKRGTWSDPAMIFFRHAEMGMVFSAQNPAFAQECYNVAAREIGREGGVGENAVWPRLHLLRLAFRLRVPDADAQFDKTLEAANKQWDGTAYALPMVLEYAAGGDGTRAARHVMELPETGRESGAAVNVLGAMADAQPGAALSLLKRWVADGTIKPGQNYEMGGSYPQTFTRLAKLLAKADPEGAAWVAAHTPKIYRWQSELYAASGLKNAAAREKAYRAALETERNYGDTPRRYAEAISVARTTGDTALVQAFTGEFAARVGKDISLFDGTPGANVAAITFQIGDMEPALCRMLLEISLPQPGELSMDADSTVWRVAAIVRAMAWLDLPRALVIADGLGKPEEVAKAKAEIIRSLLTPPDKWRSLVNQ